MRDARAVGDLHRTVWNALYDLRACFGGDLIERWPHQYVEKVNEILRDSGYEFRLAQYAEPVRAGRPVDAARLWKASFALRRAIRNATIGYRGMSPYIDPDGDYLLDGSGYQLVRSR